MKNPFKLKRPLREYVDGDCDSPFEIFMLFVIMVNVISMGLETVRSLKMKYFKVFYWVDLICLAIFIVELVIKFIAFNKNFFGEKRVGKDGIYRFHLNRWNIFDLIIVLVSILPSVPYFALARFFRVFRSFRMLRTVRSLRAIKVLKLVNNFENLRVIFKAILNALPSIVWTGCLLIVFMYAYAIIGTYIFAIDYPEFFGNLGKSFITLLQVMTFDSWVSDITRPIVLAHPLTWIYFVSYAFIAALIIMNVIIGIVVDSIEEAREIANAEKKKLDATRAAMGSSKDAVIAQMRLQIKELQYALRILEVYKADGSVNTEDIEGAPFGGQMPEESLENTEEKGEEGFSGLQEEPSETEE